MKLPPDKTIRLEILSVPAHLPVVRSAIEKACEMVGFDGDEPGRIVLSADEAMANIIKHAYKGAGDKPIEIELTPFARAGASGLRIRLRDYGVVVDRSQIKSRDLADVRPGGLGVHIMTNCMDEVNYLPAEGGGTLLTMIKTLQPELRGKKP